MKCHSGANATPIANALKRIAVIGMPNTGKSTLFNKITGANAAVGNWPGITVDILRANVKIKGELVEFVDLPGIYDLNGFSDDEKVVQKFLESFPFDLVVVVINASQIDRQILLPLQIKALGIPAVVALNMADEAKRYGISINLEQLNADLGMPALLISAKYGRGYERLIEALNQSLQNNKQSYQVVDLHEHLLEHRVDPSQLENFVAKSVQMPPIIQMTFTNRLDQLLMHPIWGIPLFFLSMLGVFWIIWNAGLPTQKLMGQLSDWILKYAIEPILSHMPEIIKDFIINGLWNGLATVASFIPLIFIFFIAMAILEDSGYLARAAYITDALMDRVGLDGRAFVMQMMGFGCNVPALMGTRVLRSRSMRLLSMLVITFSLCSARLAVFVFIIAAIFSKAQGPFVLFSLYALSFVAAFVAAAIFSRLKAFKNSEPFVLELPPYRLPTFKQVVFRSWGELRAFLSKATGYIIIGCMGVWFLTNFPVGAKGLDTLGGQLGLLLQPIMKPIGITPQLTLALIFGFVAKEVVVGSLAVIYATNAAEVAQHIAATITPIQAYSFCIFCLLYTPCLTTVVTMKAESKSWSYTIFSLMSSLVYAWICSFIFYQGALLLGFR